MRFRSKRRPIEEVGEAGIAKKRKRGKKRGRKVRKEKNSTPKSVRENYKIEALERLAADIVARAVKDYRDAGIKYKTILYKLGNGSLENSMAIQNKRRSLLAEMRLDRKFFRTTTLTDIDPEIIIAELDRQIEAYDPAKKRERKGGGNGRK